MVEKKINKAGAITIPAGIRREYGIAKGDRVEVDVDNKGKIVIDRYKARCIICESQENVKVLRGKGLCASCLHKYNALESKDK
ncbi:AbrB/MazE/SpoVT family DNA-binding domain-containing protein [Vallitalea guaymasensis]|uniref:AbrB/MazE/SpoVT family DNA-binding domain-containing protein n=1 Tax=Vallitalea guaymasensis TaxID=1185412 RepID=UPI000DE43B7D|nr:AbrB/MazE/SpoVT family DNA-binding domain-containing protein [Vallitalea guaymasensis]